MRSKRKLTNNRQIPIGTSDDSLKALRQSELASNLISASIDSIIASPDIDMNDPPLPIHGAISTDIFITEIFLEVGIINDLAGVEFTFGRGKGEGIGVGACSSGYKAAATVVGDDGARGIVVREAVEGVGDACDGHTGSVLG